MGSICEYASASEIENDAEKGILLSRYHQQLSEYRKVSISVLNNRVFESAFWDIRIPDGPYRKQIQQLAWWWYCKWEPITLKALSILCMIMTILVIWSESTFQLPSAQISIPYLILRPENSSYFWIELLSMIFVCYVCTCTYYSLLNLKFFDFCQMVPNHNTDESSLLFVGAYLCKLSFPIMYNYLNMGGLANAVNNDYSNLPVFIQVSKRDLLLVFWTGCEHDTFIRRGVQ
jgi:hypothetical protein